jgi:diguanylate cyclase (GGDEF)-like protein/PAS domain S-box-containing protein
MSEPNSTADEGTTPPVPAPAPGSTVDRRRPVLDPLQLSYILIPVAMVILLSLMHYGLIAREPYWQWIAVFLAVPVVTLSTDVLYRRHSTVANLNLRIAAQAASVATIIYLTGWGPVLSGGFAFIAMEEIALDGSRVWRRTSAWCILAVLAGQLAIWRGWAPSELTLSQANALAFLGVVMFLFVVRMAAATTERKERAEASVRLSEDRFRSLIQNSTDATMVVGADGLCTYASPAITTLLGFQPSELIGRRPTERIHPDDVQRVIDRLGPEWQGSPDTAHLQLRMARHDGRWCDVEVAVVNQVDRPSVSGYVVNIRDITERKAFEAMLAHRAMHDPLTGLANRHLLHDRLNEMLIRARRSGCVVAACFVDLDRFKEVNDTLGHEVGDQLLVEAAGRMLGVLRAGDVVGRLGGDEFVIATEGDPGSAGPEAVAERVRHELRAPFHLAAADGSPVTVSASIGVATGDRPSAEDLIRDADVALYRAKAAGRDRIVVFRP